MSRIGKKVIKIPSGVDVSIDGSTLIAKKGNIQESLVTIGTVMAIENNQLIFTISEETKQNKAFWGTYRSIASNMIEGLDKGFEKKLEINGVGYKAVLKGKILNLQLGFSHPVNYDIPNGINIEVDSKENTILIKGHNKQVVGQVAAEIRSFRPPEPYRGKGVKYSDETIIRKAGKAAK
jgi:large subunit ribosomal protein L6